MNNLPNPSRPILVLSLRVPAQHHRDLVEFLRSAVATYEELPGVRVRLLQSHDDPDRWLEIVEYPDRQTYEADQVRVEADPRLRRLLQRWRRLLAAPAGVETWEERTHEIKEAHGD